MFIVQHERSKFAAFGCLFTFVTFETQHEDFQRLFMDLTVVSARLDITSGSLFLSDAACQAQDFILL